MEAFQQLVESADTVTMKPPMLVPPVQHTTMWDGGYLTPIDNHRARLREVAEAFKSADGLTGSTNGNGKSNLHARWLFAAIHLFHTWPRV